MAMTNEEFMAATPGTLPQEPDPLQQAVESLHTQMPVSNDEFLRMEPKQLSNDEFMSAVPGQIELPVMPDVAPDDNTSAQESTIAAEFGQLRNSLTRGVHSLRQQGNTMMVGANARLLNTMDEIERKLAAGEPVSAREDPDFIRHMTPEQRAGRRAQLMGDMQSSIQGVVERQGDLERIPQHPLIKKAMSDGTFGTFWEHFKQAPATFIANLGAESLPQMAPGMIAAVPMGMAAGLPGAAVAAGMGSFGVDYLGNILQAMAEEKIDLKDPAAIEQAFRDPKLLDRVGKKAALHAAPVAAFDAASLGVAGKTLLPARIRPQNVVAAKVAELPVQLPVQGAIGAAGEAAGQFASEGKLNPAEIAAEFFGEFVTAPVEVATATMAGRKSGQTTPDIPDRPPTEAEIATAAAPPVAPAEVTVDTMQKSELAPTEPGPIFISPLRQAAELKGPSVASAEQWISTLSNQPGVKDDELNATGIQEFLHNESLNGNTRIRKEDVIAHLEENQVRVEEILQGFGEIGPDPDRVSQYGGYRAPGDTTGYRELLLRLPEDSPSDLRRQEELRARPPETLTPEERQELSFIARGRGRDGQRQAFMGTHWSYRNVLAHIRFTDRTDINGLPILHIEEIQSDWHQTGKKHGYGGKPLEWAPNGNLETAVVDNYRLSIGTLPSGKVILIAPWGSNHYTSIQEAKNAAARQVDEVYQRVPNAPFKTSWPDLAVKRMLRWAADNGYQRISFSSGDLAAQYAAGGVSDPATIRGLKEFYDKILPSIAKKWAKKFGGVSGVTRIVPEEPALTPAQNPQGGWGVKAGPLGVEPVKTVLGTPHWLDSEQEVMDWIREQGGLPTEPVFFIELPARAKTQIQGGLPLFSEVAPGATPQSTIPSGPTQTKKKKWSAQTKRFYEIAKHFEKRFGLSKKIVVAFTENNEQELGYLDLGVKNWWAITINLRHHKTALEVYSTLMHEFGHAVAFDAFIRAPLETQQAIRAEYDEWARRNPRNKSFKEILTQRDNFITRLLDTRRIEGSPDFPLTRLTPTKQDYWAGFDEWFAEQVARWATTSPKALTVADNFFAKLGQTIRELFQRATQIFPGYDFTAAPAMQKWLDSFQVGDGMETIWREIDIQTTNENQEKIRPVAPEQPAVPRQPEVTPIEQILRQADPPKNPPPPPQGPPPPPPNPPQTPRGVGQTTIAFVDHFNKWVKYGADLLQMAELNKHIAQLQAYVAKMRAAHIEESKINDRALQVAKEMRRLNPGAKDALFGFIDDITNMVYRTADEVSKNIARHPTPQEFQDLVRQHGVTTKGLEIYQQINKMFDVMLTLAHQNANANAQRHITDPVALAKKLDEIRGGIEALRKKPYFPFMRFGRHVVMVKNAAGDTIHRVHVERKGLVSAEKMQQKIAEQLRGRLQPGERVELDVLSADAEPMIGVPPALLEVMADRLELSTDQRDALAQLRMDLSPAQSFAHRFQHKAYTPGYSKDFERAFAKYFFHGAKWYVKTKYADAMRDDIKSMKDTMNVSATPVKRKEIAYWLENHLKNDFLNPKADFMMLKAGLVFWALAYVPSSAFVNMTQTPMVTFPYLAGKFNDIKASAALAYAMTQLNNFYKKGAYDNQNDFEMRAISYGIRTGRITEAQAPELAGMADGGHLGNAFGGTSTERGLNVLMDKGMKMFELAEQWNRRIAYRAALKLAVENPTNKYAVETAQRYATEVESLRRQEGFTEAEAKAIVVAAHATDQTQFVYTRYNRPRIMRGKFGTLFLFKKYLTSMIGLGINNKADFLPRYILMSMMVYGFMGLPGAEDLKDIIRALANWLFGKDFNIEKETRRFITDILGTNKYNDFALHGLAKHGFGLPFVLNGLGNFVNAPKVPEFDLSRAGSIGNILPVNIGKLMIPAKDQNRVMVDESMRAGGVPGNVMGNIYKAVMSRESPTDFKRWEKAVPRVLGNVSRAYRAFDEGRERNARGATIVKYDVRDPTQAIEVAGMALGFQPLRQTQTWDNIIAKMEVTNFIDMRREMLMRQMSEAVMSRNDKERDLMVTAIKKYNAELPQWAKAKSISSESLTRSLNTRVQARTRQEMGLPLQNSNVGIYNEIDRLYPRALEIRPVK